MVIVLRLLGVALTGVVVGAVVRTHALHRRNTMHRYVWMVIVCAVWLAEQNAFAAEHTIKMLNTGAAGIMVFEPDFLRIRPGDTLTFVPGDPGHYVMSYHVPEGGAAWQGAPNEAVSVTLEHEGVYIYRCGIHTAVAMVGVIQVGEARNLASAKQAAAELAKNFVVNEDRLDKLFAQVK